MTMTSISPLPMREPRLAGGRSSATASPVTWSSTVRLAKAGPGADIAASIGSCRVDLDAYVLAHSDQWQRLEELTARRRLDGAQNGRTRRPLPAHRDPPLDRASATPDPALVAYLSSMLVRAREPDRRHPAPRGASRRRSSPSRFPVALYRLRWVVAGDTRRGLRPSSPS